MPRSQGLTDTTAAKYAKAFGALVRERREAQKMTQDDLALAAGVGRRFVIDLEAGKPTTHLGKALAVATEVGLRPLDLMAENRDDSALLPDLIDYTEEPSRG
jgi:y4mF family transcriptional regulator